MKRSAIKRGAPLERSKPLRRQSKKRRAVMVERRELVAKVLAERPTCEAGPLLASVGFTGCQGQSVHVHEPHTRGRGGSILDEKNTVSTCAACHSHLHRHPREALAIGLLVSGHGAPSHFDDQEGVKS